VLVVTDCTEVGLFASLPWIVYLRQVFAQDLFKVISPFPLWRSSEKFEFLSGLTFSSYSHPFARRQNNGMVAVDSKSTILNGREKGAHLSLFAVYFAAQGENVNLRQRSFKFIKF